MPRTNTFEQQFAATDLGRLAHAAASILHTPGIDGELLLTYLIWPTPEIERSLRTPTKAAA